MEDQLQPELINDPDVLSGPEEGGRASDEVMGDLHGRTAHELARMMTYGNVKLKLAAVGASIKFLKDNNITSDLRKSPPGKALRDALPTVAELEQLMRLTPGNDR